MGKVGRVSPSAPGFVRKSKVSSNHGVLSQHALPFMRWPLIMEFFLQEAWLTLVSGDPDSETASFADAAFQINPASMFPDDALDDHQTKACPLFLGGIERFENMIDLFLGYSSAGVRDACPDEF